MTTEPLRLPSNAELEAEAAREMRHRIAAEAATAMEVDARELPPWMLLNS